MAFRRSMALSYGVDSVGVVVFGGENRQYLLTAYDLQENYDSLSVMAVFRVYGVGSTDLARTTSLAAHVAALKYAFTHSADLTLSADTERAFTCNYTSVLTSPTWTAVIVDTSGPGFTSADIGKHISVERIGTFRIISVSGQNATVKLTPDIDQQGTAPGVNAILLKNLVRTKESDHTRGYRGRCQIHTINDPRDTKYRRTFMVEWRFEKPADDARDLGRRLANVNVRTMANGLRTVALAGIYTAVTANDALAQYTAQFSTWASSTIGTLGGSFEGLPIETEYDDENALVTFTALYRELNVEESIGAVDKNNASLHNQSLVVVRQNNYAHGLPGLVKPPMVQVNYSTLVDKSTVPANYRTSIYTSIVRPHLMNQIRSLFGSGDIVLMDESPSFDPVSGAMSVFLNVQLNQGNTSPILAFAKTCTYSLSAQKDVRNRWTGQKHKYVSYSPSPMIQGRVTVMEVRRGPPSYEGRDDLARAVSASSSGQSLSVFLQQNLGIQGPGALARGSALNEGDPRQFQVPGEPPFGDEITEASSGRNKWNFLDAAVEHTPSFRGRTLEGTGGTTNMQDLVTESLYQTSWFWGEEVLDNVVPFVGSNINVNVGEVIAAPLSLDLGAPLPDPIPPGPPPFGLVNISTEKIR